MAIAKKAKACPFDGSRALLDHSICSADPTERLRQLIINHQNSRENGRANALQGRYHPSIAGPLAPFKRLLDITGAASGLLLLTPIFLLTAIAIRLESEGPVLFLQRRSGLNGNPFTMFKFRSMYLDAEARREKMLHLNQIKDGPMFKVSDDPRITGVGRFIRRSSIDELPQLLNVLRGEMSLVGPRPMPVYEVAEYQKRHLFRFEVKPGLSGLWQVSGRSDLSSFHEMLELDRDYIETWSLGLDLKIILKTVKVVLSGRGAC